MHLKPIQLDTSKVDIEAFKEQYTVTHTIDIYRDLLEDVFLVRNPQYKFNKNYKAEFEEFIKKQKVNGSLNYAGSWFYFPWNETLGHYLPDDMHQEVRTARNVYLITKEEQKKFYNFSVGIAGMSVGSHSALTVSLIGGARHMKIADSDVISASNLNRIRLDFTKVGQSKVHVVKEYLYHMNPYADIEVYDKGLSIENLDEFISGCNVLVDAIDNLELKIRLRLKAKEQGIPVIMATDNGDNVIIDIERYDIDKNIELFNGAIGHVTLEEFQSFKPQEMPKLATKIAGANIVVPRMLASILEVGKTIYSWPQLGDAATLAGVATAYAIKRISLGQKTKTGKFEVNLDSVFDPDYFTVLGTKEREDKRNQYLKKIGL
jgi:molybdopterin/thiamine biosynthesis adenylyltransferase